MGKRRIEYKEEDDEEEELEEAGDQRLDLRCSSAMCSVSPFASEASPA